MAQPRHDGTLARRWYYTPTTHRAYSVRQISPGDRRLLAEFALSLTQAAAAPDRSARDIADLLFDRVLAGGNDLAVGFAALEATAAGDRVIGVAAYAPKHLDDAGFGVGVDSAFRGEHVGRILLATLTRHARRAGIRRLSGEMASSNLPMQSLAEVLGFAMEIVVSDSTRRRLVLPLT